MSRTLEVRTYRLHSGTRETFHRLVQERSLPLLAVLGMDVVHAGPCALEPDGYVLMRAYDHAEHLRRSQEAFYASDDWRLGPREEILACIEAYLAVVLDVEVEAIEALRTLPRPPR